jgi:hypothetical protein
MALAALVALAGGTAVALVEQGPATATSLPTYVRTLGGEDFNTEDIRVFPQFLVNSGGGVYPLWDDDGSHVVPPTYFESGVDLPVGAAITSVTFWYHDCNENSAGAFYAGSYSAVAGSYAPIVQETHGGTTCATQTLTKSGSPLATVVGGRRYVVGVHLDSSAVTLVRTSSPSFLLLGARIKFNCPSTCR